MALKFWLGGVSSDKSDKLIEYVLEEAVKNPTRQYLVVVPEQICLKTQQKYVSRSCNKGILNIDILPFTRLAHRISDEVGDSRANVTTLDDMGKSLLIEHLASMHREELSIIGESIDKLGYVEKVKSAISEYMQYGISVEKAFEMSDFAKGRGKGLLSAKLKDIALIYEWFTQYIKDKYTTVEETLDRTADIVHNSETIRNSVIIFDGFTGFTPVQIKLIGTLMEYALDIHVALLLESDEAKTEQGEAETEQNEVQTGQKSHCIQKNPSKHENDEIKEHELFYMSRRTIHQLEVMADERRITIANSYKARKSTIDNINEKATKIVYTDKSPLFELNNTPEIIAGQNPEEEMRMVAGRILRLIRDEGYRYKDIAIITGDIEAYRNTITRTLGSHQIPFFVDKSEPILMNPFTEYVRSLISIYTGNFAVDDIFRFLKSGLSGFEGNEIALLENYCLAAGVKGYKKWHSRFYDTTLTFDESAVYEIEKIREKVIEKIDLIACELQSDRRCKDAGNDSQVYEESRIRLTQKYTVCDFASALYKVIEAEGIEDILKERAAAFEQEGNLEKKEEYSQIYIRFMKILEQLCELIPEERIGIKDFGELIDAALSEVRIGIIPGRTDYIQVGDLTRSRLGEIKALFVIGANDGIIPKINVKSGILNDADKEYLLSGDDELVLAPTAREDAYTQRLYLYMMMHSPSERLYISFSSMGSDGKSLLPSYIIRKLLIKYPEVKIKTLPVDMYERVEDYRDAHLELLDSLSDVMNDSADNERTEDIIDLLKALAGRQDSDDGRLYRIIERAILTGGFGEDSIGKALAGAIYGKKIVGSVTRLETYANCAYRYFLQYGLKLSERELFSFEANELGMIFHASLSEYAKMMEEEGINWAEIDADDEKRLMDKAVEVSIAKEHLAKLYSEARTTYLVTRIKRIMTRTARVLKNQLAHGEFTPKYFEVGFDELGDLDCINVKLSDEEYMKLVGRIDRVDIAKCDDGIYVKIIDYKSSSKKMDLLSVYEGRQLQLLTYLNAAMESQNHEGCEVLPAGILYYRIDDPFISNPASDEDVQKAIMKELRLAGLINSDGQVAELIDRDISDGSEVLSVTRTKAGGFRESKQLVSGADFKVLSSYVNTKIREIGDEILSGNIAIAQPDGDRRFTEVNCDYCPYKSVCTNKTGLYCTWDENDDSEESEEESYETIVSDSKYTNDEVIAFMKKVLGE